MKRIRDSTQPEEDEDAGQLTADAAPSKRARLEETDDASAASVTEGASSLTDAAENFLLARDHALPANNAIQAKLVAR